MKQDIILKMNQFKNWTVHNKIQALMLVLTIVITVSIVTIQPLMCAIAVSLYATILSICIAISIFQDIKDKLQKIQQINK